MIRLFRELLANSIDHHNGKKELRIAVRGHYEKNHLDVRISDNGPGIPEKHSIEIFDIFRTLENKRKTTSSGVGLTIVKKIVDSLNRNISIGQGLDGRGATFVLRLPLKVIC